MEIAGKTTDQKLVVRVPAYMYFQEGLPLCFIFDEMQKRNLIPSWVHLFLDLQKGGMGKRGSDKMYF